MRRRQFLQWLATLIVIPLPPSTLRITKPVATTFMEAGTDATFGFQFYSSTVGTVASDTAQVRTGPRSAKFTTGAAGQNAQAKQTAILADAGRRINFAVRITNLPTGATTAILAVDNTIAQDIINVSVTTTGILQLRDDNGTQVGTNGSTLSTGVWYRLSLAYTVTSTTVNEFRLFKDGVLDISVTNGTLLFTGSDTLVVGYWWDTTQGNNLVINHDDIYVDDSSALTDTGDIHVTAKLPNANNVNNFTAAIGANPANRWTNVNERALSETNGWEDTSASTQLENYTLQNAATGDVNLSAVTLVARTAWIWAKQLVGVAGTPGITNNGTTTAITLTLTSALYTNIVDSASYPSNVAGIGMRSAGIVADATDFFEGGMLIAYIPYDTGYAAPIRRSRMREW